ncbi:hypothetical protein C6A63_07235 [Escherichia coli]|nr:hypothetical protein CA696_006660 [Escherichia coli]ATI07543.1 hypothetical protein CO715_18570 [Escherichia coli M12]ESD26250.1 hypothetical protein HMPREF1600_02765 [Escherichia coli 907715]ESD63825.1 hypothetical protein HMPREF1606_00054 [Escherichia coli 908522]EFH8816435.1 hypothetical protein [Escherichia coli]
MVSAKARKCPVASGTVLLLWPCFSSLKKQCIRKRAYKTQDLDRADIFDDIDVFNNRRRW